MKGKRKSREGFEPPTADSESTVLTDYTTRTNNKKRKKKRARIELANPKDLDLNQAHLTALLPLPKQKCRKGGNHKEFSY